MFPNGGVLFSGTVTLLSLPHWTVLVPSRVDWNIGCWRSLDSGEAGPSQCVTAGYVPSASCWLLSSEIIPIEFFSLVKVCFHSGWRWLWACQTVTQRLWPPFMVPDAYRTVWILKGAMCGKRPWEGRNEAGKPIGRSRKGTGTGPGGAGDAGVKSSGQLVVWRIR